MSVESRAKKYGEISDGWKIQELLGSGSNGQTCVFRVARNIGLPEEGAVKIVNIITVIGEFDRLSKTEKEDYEAERKRLYKKALDEISLMNKLEFCPNVVRYHAWNYEDWVEEKQFGRDLLIRMDCLDTLSELEGRGIFEESEIVRIGIDICTALVECEKQEIIHRDIKPANIFKRQNHNSYLLGDFGISRIVDRSHYASTAIGTKPYAAPEQYNEKYDIRADIYSLGLTLYELCNENRLPYTKFSGHVSAEQIEKRLEAEQLPPLPEDKVSEELSGILLTACAHNPSKRYQSAQEFLNALTCAASHGKRNAFRDSQINTVPSTDKTDENVIPAAEEEPSELPIDSYATEPARPRGEAESNYLKADNENKYTDSIESNEEIRSWFPGTVIEVKCKIGQVVHKGDVLVVMLSMGMENELPAPCAGTITFVADVIGKEINANDLLIVIDETHEKVEKLSIAAEKGDPAALCELGDRYMAGKGVPKDEVKSAECYARAALYNNYHGAQFRLALCYMKGIGVAPNESMAVIWIKKAANQRFAPAQILLDIMDKHADEDLTGALCWYAKATEQEDSFAQLELSDYFTNSIGLDFDIGRWYEIMIKDKIKAAEWYTRAAAQGNKKAQSRLGDFYMNGYGVSQDAEEAVKWYRKAADQGEPNAQYDLAKCYMGGSGIQKDIAKAIELFAKAAEKNNKAVTELEHYYQDMQKKLCDNSYIVKSDVSGTVYIIKCKNGQKVQVGDILFILLDSDSTEITAPISGTVEFIAAYKTRKILPGTFLAAISLPA